MVANDKSGESEMLAKMGRDLLDWYEHHRRDLPWRQSRDPYAVWVSEIMLQQTRVETVLAYYAPFMRQFPTLESLAGAELDAVLKAWEGLGYYARARNLYRAARQVVLEMNGNLPHAPDKLSQLPGIGRYTAAAIASIAFQHDVVALDGNLRRVLCRLFAIDEDPRRSRVQRHLESKATAMLPLGQGLAGDMNQALMDVGATICMRTQPRCLLCPLAVHCLARLRGIQNDLPIRTPRPKRPHHDVTAAVIRNDRGQILIAQRPLDGMLGGLWEFPGGKRMPGESLPDCLRREICEEIDIDIQVGGLLCAIDHTFTHFHMTLYAFDCQWTDGMPQCLGCMDLRWVSLDQLDTYAFPVADQKIIAVLREQG